VFAAKRELYVIALRVWLAELSSRDARTRAAYITWRRRTTWPSPARFDEGHGGFPPFARKPSARTVLSADAAASTSRLSCSREPRN
jgi:hypothetical protein